MASVIAEGAMISAVNLAEVASKLADAGLPDDAIRDSLDLLGLEVVAFDAADAYLTARLRPLTRSLGHSLGDRACLALSQSRGKPAVTADRSWGDFQTDVPVRLIR